MVRLDSCPSRGHSKKALTVFWDLLTCRIVVLSATYSMWLTSSRDWNYPLSSCTSNFIVRWDEILVTISRFLSNLHGCKTADVPGIAVMDHRYRVWWVRMPITFYWPHTNQINYIKVGIKHPVLYFWRQAQCNARQGIVPYCSCGIFMFCLFYKYLSNIIQIQRGKLWVEPWFELLYHACFMDPYFFFIPTSTVLKILTIVTREST